MAVEVAAQAEHVHQRLGRATLGIDHVLNESGELARNRLRGRVANGQDWLDAAMEQFDLTRAALESLSTANPSLVRQVMGIKGPRIPWAAYVLPITIGITADLLIVLAGAARGSQQYTGLMLLLQASLLGFLFGARLGLVAALTPLVAIGVWLLAPIGRRFVTGGAAPTAARRRRIRVRAGAGGERRRLRRSRCATATGRATLRPVRAR